MSSGRSGHATYYLDVSLVSQNQGGNYSTVNVHFYAIADSGWNGFASGIGFSATGYGNGSFSFDGGSIEIVSYNFNVAHDANGYGSANFGVHSNDTGTSTFAGPMDLSQGINLPRIPKPPGAVRNLAVAVASRNATVTFIAPADNGGSAINNYVIQYSKDGGAFTGTVNNVSGTYTYVSLAPGSYVFRVYAHNSIGNGPSTSTSAVKVKSGGKVRVGGAWKDGIPKVRVGGVWKDAIVKVRVGGVWKDAL